MSAGVKDQMAPSIRLGAFLLLCTLFGTTFACKNGMAPPYGMVCCGDAVVNGAIGTNSMECCSGKWVTGGGPPGGWVLWP